MTCPELTNPKGKVPKVFLQRYSDLHSEGRRLISGWFERAWNERDCSPENSFEPFIFAWFAFNGWAACVTGTDQDRAYIDALSRDQSICEAFTNITSASGSAASSSTQDFAALWPIFDVRALRQKHIDVWQLRGAHGDSRERLIARYFAEGATRFEPRCWRRHEESGEPIPPDWPHTLAALYRVRCNLFHGEKAAHSEMDQRIVLAALRTLLNFLRETCYLN